MHSAALLIPAYNDWEATRLLLGDLDSTAAESGLRLRVLLVDDGSSIPMPAWDPSYRALESVDVLHLRRNLGHQRAIAAGLVYLFESKAGDRPIVVMDGDGEDRPRDVPRLLSELASQQAPAIVFAARIKRLESFLFRAFYHLYRLLHWQLTGISVRIGNFSAIPGPFLERLVVASELWNHYAAAVVRSKLPYRTIPIARGSRLHGKPQMAFTNLVVHGLSAMSVFGDVIGVRLLALNGALMFVITLLFALEFGALPGPAPGWKVASAVTLLLVGQTMILALIVASVILGARSAANVIPLRDAPYFIGKVERIFPRGD